MQISSINKEPEPSFSSVHDSFEFQTKELSGVQRHCTSQSKLCISPKMSSASPFHFFAQWWPGVRFPSQKRMRWGKIIKLDFGVICRNSSPDLSPGQEGGGLCRSHRVRPRDAGLHRAEGGGVRSQGVGIKNVKRASHLVAKESWLT